MKELKALLSIIDKQNEEIKELKQKMEHMIPKNYKYHYRGVKISEVSREDLEKGYEACVNHLEARGELF